MAAFAAIGTSQDSTGEYCRTLFSVILISLTLSWVTAVTTTPLLCKTFLKTAPKDRGRRSDTEGSLRRQVLSIVSGLLSAGIRFRWITVAIVIGMFILSLLGFRYVKNSFFPDGTSPMYYIDFWFPEGTHIDETSRYMKQAEEYL